MNLAIPFALTPPVVLKVPPMKRSEPYATIAFTVPLCTPCSG